MISLKNKIVDSTNHKKPILTDVFYKDNNTKKPVVIFCHGYKGYKDWGAWNLAANHFVENDLFFVKFNFSHNGGTVEEPIDFPDLEAFGQNNYILELDDLEDIIDWVTNNKSFENEIDPNNIILIGHSRGGGIVSIKASENKQVSKVISWCGVSDYGAHFPKGEPFELWKKTGIAYVENGRTKQQMPHYIQFYNNFKENEDRLTIQNAISKLSIPHLIIYGENDDVILHFESQNQHKWNPESELFIVKKMDHAMGSSHPWTDDKLPNFLNQVVEKSIDFIKK